MNKKVEKVYRLAVIEKACCIAICIAILVGVILLGVVLTVHHWRAEEAKGAATGFECLSEAAVPDLTGSWIEAGTKPNAKRMSAEITDNTIDVYWSAEETRALYWAGTYVTPAKAETYTWSSINDHAKTDTALLAAGGDTKDFTYNYNDGEITFDVTTLGVTTTVHLIRR